MATRGGHRCLMLIDERDVTLDTPYKGINRGRSGLMVPPPPKSFREFLRTPFGRRGIFEPPKIRACICKERKLPGPEPGQP
jgi:hypothetical protein